LGLAPSVLAATVPPALVGPHGNTATSTPKAYGLWSFATLDNGKISCSGQPLLSEFKWLKNSGLLNRLSNFCNSSLI
jgi:hypothetical protein